MIRLLLILAAALCATAASPPQAAVGCADANGRLRPAADCARGGLKADEPADLRREGPELTSPAAVAPVASGVRVADWLRPAPPPGRDAGEVQGAFRFLCAPGHLSYDDPLVYPGQPGKSHLHQWFGNTKADAHSTFASLRRTGDSTCNNLLNRSAYWIPAMMHPSGKVVRPDWLSVYYKRYPADSQFCRKVGRACVQLPRGLRYVFGFSMADHARSDPARARWWNCDGPGAAPGHFATIAEAAKGCPAGARIGGVLFSPDCWNGRDLDSPDHRSHMAYSTYVGDAFARCPATHPYVVPTFTLGAWYTNDGSAARWRLSSDDMAGMARMPGGATLHADWWGAWEDSVLEAWHRNCIDKLLSCHSGNLGNGRQMAMVAGYDAPNKMVLVPPPPRP